MNDGLCGLYLFARDFGMAVQRAAKFGQFHKITIGQHKTRRLLLRGFLVCYVKALTDATGAV